MSGPKRLQEEGSHSSSLKRPLEDSCTFPNSTGKVTPSVAGDYHSLFEPGQDGRLAKIQRTESRDADKRLLPIYRVVSTSNDPCLDHPISSDNRLESRDIKDIRDARSENREMKGENREFYADTRLDSQGVKGEKDVKLETRGDEKDVKSDMTHMDFKGEIKAEKDSCMGGNIHLSWKEPKEKEHHRGKRYPDPSVDGFDPWRVSCINFHSTEVVVKETSATEERDYFEAREAVGENKIDWKCEEKSKEKDRKRKDEKHRDWGERDKDRSERRNNLQALVREERETERWERERKDAGKDKEKVKDRENDHAKREAASVNEKESLHNEKEVGEGSCKFPEQETANFEQKRAKEIDGWKGGDRDARERKKERDVDGDGDRHERRGRGYEKESDEGCTEGDGAAEREREVFGYGVQQRRRMLRPRGTPQAASREPRFRSRARDNEGSQGKSEVSTVVYKVGECMQELIRLWKEYEGSQEKKNDENSLNGPTLEIRIPAEYVTATNRQVRGGQLWGTDIYTDDSDLVAVLMHTGYCRPTASPPPPAIHELRATIRVLPPQDCYISTLRNNVRSRAWGAAIGCSFRVERCCILKKGGGSIDLEPCLTHISAVEPTLAPASVERTITTRAAASNFRQQRFVREVTIQYSLCNEPWVKYSISVVADKGLKKPLYTSARLKKGEVLYVETHSNRYELCFNVERALCNGWGGTNSTTATSHLLESEPEKIQNHVQHAQSGDRNTTDREHIVDVFRWSRCKQPLPQKVMRNIGIPLPVEYLEVLEENLDWEDVQWSQTGVWVAGKEYALARVHFLSPN